VIGEGLVKTSSQLQALRFLMGMFESGFVPGCAYLISSYYTQDEFLLRYCLFFSMAILAGAFNGVSKPRQKHRSKTLADTRNTASCDCVLLDEGSGWLLWYACTCDLEWISVINVVGWRWIFIMEGLLTVLASLLSAFFIVPFPEQNNMFPEKEKACLLARKADEEVEDSDEPVWKHTLAACRDLKVWLS
jgi:MFS family permease